MFKSMSAGEIPKVRMLACWVEFNYAALVILNHESCQPNLVCRLAAAASVLRLTFFRECAIINRVPTEMIYRTGSTPNCDISG